jgi:glycosyltransferase involved in cell wall biosynthesis
MSKTNAQTKVIYLTAGAGGMFCGSCMHDNALATALNGAGWDVQLVSTYTPIRTDQVDVSVDHVLFGGLNVYLQQKIPLFRYLPSAIDRFLDSPKLIRRLTANAAGTDPKTLGSLAVSMLKGTGGNQRKEVRRMCKWLALAKPDVLILSNVLIGGCLPEIKKQLDVPVLVTLQGDDVFLDSLLPKFKQQCVDLIAKIADSVDGFIVHSEFYADYISNYFGIDRAKFHVTPLGLDVRPFWGCHEVKNDAGSRQDDASFKIGYLARLAPEKGLHHLVDGFIELKQRLGCEHAKLVIAGWQSDQWNDYTQAQWEKLAAAGLENDWQNLGSPELQSKIELLQDIDVLSVPTEFLEPKGLYALEAMAAGVPVVLPAHGAFLEMIDSTGGGALVVPKSAQSWADAMEDLIKRPDHRRSLGQRGQQSVHLNRNSGSMAASTSAVIRKVLDR